MVYLLRGNSLRNNSRSDANRAQLHYLKQTYGDKWWRGAEKDPSVSLDPNYAKNKRKEVEKKSQEGFRTAAKSAITELRNKGTISGLQAAKLAHIADQQ